MIKYLVDLTKYIILLSLLYPFSVMAQDKEGVREIIIIEKTIDADGNVISKKIQRHKGSLSDEDIDNMIEEVEILPESKKFDFPDFERIFSFNDSARPSLGVMIAQVNGQVEVSEVLPNSGAEAADIRTGDRIIAIQGVPVSSVAEIKDAIADSESGDEIEVTIWRDGGEMDKKVTLESSNQNLFGSFPEPEEIDQILDKFRAMGFDEAFENGGVFDIEKMKKLRFENLNEEAKRPQLGVFIDESQASVEVTDVVPESPADLAGVESGDIIQRMDDNMITSFRELKALLNTKKVGDDLTLTVLRDGQEKLLKLKL